MSDVLETNAPALSATSDFPAAPQTAPDLGQDTSVQEKPEPVDDTPPPKEPTVDEQIAGDEPLDPNKLRKKDLQSRFSELTAAEKAAKARADAAEAELATIRAREAQASREAEERKLGAPKPDRHQFDDPDAYDAAVIQWAAAKAERDGYNKAVQERQQAETQKSQEEAMRTFNTRLESARAEIPDFQEVAMNKDLPVTQVMSLAIMNLENGPQVLYHLGKNPELARKICEMGPVSAAMEMGRLAATVTSPAKNTVSRAAPPISRVTGRVTTQRAPDEMSGDEYFAMRQAQIKEARSNR